MSDLISAINTLTPGIQTRYVSMYDEVWSDSRDKYEPMMDFALPSDGLYSIYAHYKSAPMAQRWPRGTPRGAKGFDAFQFQVVNHDWSVGVRMHENDVMDDRTNSAVSRAQQAGSKAARIPVKVFFQIDGAQTNTKLLPSVPNAPDGAALFSATDGNSLDRFGVSGGNVVSGSGVASVAAIQADYASGIVRLKSFLDTEGEPFYDDSIEEKGITVVAGVTNYYVLKRALMAMNPQLVVLNAAATENVAATAGPNQLKEIGVAPVRLITNPYKTGNSWSMYAHAAPTKPIFEQTRQAMQYLQVNRHNNGDCARDKEVGWYWDWRAGYGVNIPIGCVQISN